jgi:hypothetical protein
VEKLSSLGLKWSVHERRSADDPQSDSPQPQHVSSASASKPAASAPQPQHVSSASAIKPAASAPQPQHVSTASATKPAASAPQPQHVSTASAIKPAASAPQPQHVSTASAIKPAASAHQPQHVSAASATKPAASAQHMVSRVTNESLNVGEPIPATIVLPGKKSDESPADAKPEAVTSGPESVRVMLSERFNDTSSQAEKSSPKPLGQVKSASDGRTDNISIPCGADAGDTQALVENLKGTETGPAQMPPEPVKADQQTESISLQPK